MMLLTKAWSLNFAFILIFASPINKFFSLQCFILKGVNNFLVPLFFISACASDVKW